MGRQRRTTAAATPAANSQTTPANKMGRPLKANKLTPAERKRLSRQKADVRAREYVKEKEKEQKLKESEDGKEELRLKWQRQKKSQREGLSKQKRYGLKQKDKTRKRNAKDSEAEEVKSTGRVRKHRGSLKVKYDFKKKVLSTPMRKSKQRLENVLGEASRGDKVDFIRSVVESQSPGTKRDLHLEPTPTSLSGPSTPSTSTAVDTSLVAAYTQLKGKRDKLSNCVKRALLTTMADGSSKKKVRKIGASYSTFKKVKGMNLEHLLQHCKTKMKTRPPKVTEEAKDQINDFYNTDDISRVLPYKNKTIKMKNKAGVREKVAIRVMEITLLQAYNKFRERNPDIKVDRRSFEKQRPRNVRLKRCAQRLVCACSYHLNIDYLRRTVIKLLKVNGEDTEMFSTNEKLMLFVLCDKNIRCILGNCVDCKDFKNLKALISDKLKCSKECHQKNIDCVALKHTISTKQFEKIIYKHKGKEKKKIALVDKDLTFQEFVNLFIKQLKGFPRHRFNVEHTKEVYDDAVGYLDEGVLLKVMDFSQNYTCLLLEEIMSLHWQQNTVVVYPVVVLRIEDVLREDHFVFFSEDKKKDPWFVELCNDKIMEFYAEKGVAVKYDIEFTDGCGSQFKSVNAFKLFAQRSLKTRRVFFETAHGKSKSDGLGGVVKSYCSSAVASGDATIRDCNELMEFCREVLTVEDRSHEEGVMINRVFYNISIEEIERYRNDNPIQTYYHLKDTLKIHQISNKLNCSRGIHHQDFPCCCAPCMDGTPEYCKHALTHGVISSDLSSIQQKWSVFKEKGVQGKKKNNDDDDDDVENERDEFIDIEADNVEEEFKEGEAYSMLTEGDVAVIQSGDEYHPYYLLKLDSTPFETTKTIKDDYNHEFPANHRVIKGNYLEVFKEMKDGELYYVENKWSAMVSSLCVVGVCPDLEEATEKRRGVQETMFLVDGELHQALCELVQ